MYFNEQAQHAIQSALDVSVASVFGLLNSLLLSVGALFAAYHFFSATLYAAQRGEFLNGRVPIGPWFPLRMALGLGLLVPLPSGFNVAQKAAYAFVKQGSLLAEQVWSRAESRRAPLHAYPESVAAPVLRDTLKTQYQTLVTQAGCYGLLSELAKQKRPLFEGLSSRSHRGQPEVPLLQIKVGDGSLVLGTEFQYNTPHAVETWWTTTLSDEGSLRNRIAVGFQGDPLCGVMHFDLAHETFQLEALKKKLERHTALSEHQALELAQEIRRDLIETKTAVYLKALLSLQGKMGPLLFQYYFNASQPFPLSREGPSVLHAAQYTDDFYRQIQPLLETVWDQFYKDWSLQVQALNRKYQPRFLSVEDDELMLLGVLENTIERHLNGDASHIPAAEGARRGHGWLKAGRLHHEQYLALSDGFNWLSHTLLEGDHFQPLFHWPTRDRDQDHLSFYLPFGIHPFFSQHCGHPAFYQSQEGPFDPRRSCLAVLHAALQTATTPPPALEGAWSREGQPKHTQAFQRFTAAIRTNLDDLFSNSGNSPFHDFIHFGKQLLKTTETAWSTLPPGSFNSMESVLLWTSWALGFLCYFGAPLIPFVTFGVAVLGWFLLVLEATLGAPLLALSWLTNPPTETGQTRQGLTLLTGIFLRPVFIVLGLILAELLVNPALFYLKRSLGSLLQAPLSDTEGLLGSLIGPLSVFAIAGVVLISRLFSLIHYLPHQLMRWFGWATSADGSPSHSTELYFTRSAEGNSTPSLLHQAQIGPGRGQIHPRLRPV